MSVRLVALILIGTFFAPGSVFGANTLLQVSVSGGVTSICNDGIDNDSDGLTDYPADPGCTGATDEDEFNVIPPPAPTSTPIFGGGPLVGSPSPSLASAVFTGVAYPGSFITLLKDGEVISVSPADASGTFSINLSNVNPGTYTFSLYASDVHGVRSDIYQIPLNVVGGLTTSVSGIYLSPTIYTNKIVTEKGSTITFEGYATPHAPVTLTIVSPSGAEQVLTTADATGAYTFLVDTEDFPESLYNAYVTFLIDELNEVQSKIISFTIGKADVFQLIGNECGRFDLNDDCRVNLIDFSIMAFWYKKLNPPLKNDLNGDGVVDLIDLSILITKWTG